MATERYKPYLIGRSMITGRYVTLDYALKHPQFTVIYRVVLHTK